MVNFEATNFGNYITLNEISKEYFYYYKNELKNLVILKMFNFKEFIHSKYSKEHIYKNDEVLIKVYQYKDYSDLVIYAKTLEYLHKWYKKFINFINYNSSDVEIDLKTYFLTDSGLQYKSEYINEFVVDADYYPFLDAKKFFKAFMKSDSNILILAGDYGIGKSKFAQLLLKLAKENYDILGIDEDDCINVSYIKDTKILDRGDLWKELEDDNFVLFDDLEFSLLAPRDLTAEDERKNNFLSNLLSFSDGVVKNNSKIIITTNQDISDIDKALLRDGRLFGIYQFRPLHYNEANKIWKKYFDYDLPIEEEMITQASLAKMINDKQNNIVEEEFIFDKSIDILHKINKKIGF